MKCRHQKTNRQGVRALPARGWKRSRRDYWPVEPLPTSLLTAFFSSLVAFALLLSTGPPEPDAEDIDSCCAAFCWSENSFLRSALSVVRLVFSGCIAPPVSTLPDADDLDSDCIDFSDSDSVFFAFSRFAALASFFIWSLDFIESLDVAGADVCAIAVAVVAANAAAISVASSFFMCGSSGWWCLGRSRLCGSQAGLSAFHCI